MKPRLDLIGLVVRDMGASLEFYRRLGFDFPPGAEDEGHVEVTLPGGLRFAWDSLEVIRSFDPAYEFHPQHAGAYLCESPAAVDALYRELLEAGYQGHKAPWDAFWGQRYAVVKDPDGHTVDLFAPL
ncbi:Glyoxalase/Bleomycin resistance protein/Dioxygenase superfamily protein [Calidithermus terrae]|uniref:Glyoxalase/Bleomycin resistance protein/Dioxygenase superfamily protein n=1 Tax=Calidithermus terrae TaxID=1408545 RepID=A0A399EJC9_9DEIN|nr:VOC family protein [Calidithermus terrae]RIH84235.1 Glyoxalase/Bleomycin resistance protein/Dioxygenase superfamily protein [Calidithermus terrae]